MKAPALIILVILFCTITIAASAAENEQSAGEITGKIIDEKSKDPISYASVILLSACDSTLIAGAISDENGDFRLNNLTFGKYILRASYVGYKAAVMNNIVISRKNTEFEINEMKLAENVTILDDVVIIGKRPKSKENTAKIVFKKSAAGVYSNSNPAAKYR
jgi:uncharacterized surface anchored protein